MELASFSRKGIAVAACGAVALAATVSLAGPACAQSYPTRPVRIIVPYGAGGIADVTMRIVAEKLSTKLGQQFVIDNRPGAAGIIGLKAVMSSPHDGYTLAMIGGGLTAAKALFKSLPYDLERDFIPISTTAAYSIVVATKTGSPFKSVNDMIAAAKASPGKLNVGSINPGSNQHLAGELFKSLAGISATTIPFKTTPELLTGVIRGDVDIAFEYQAAMQGPLDDRQIIAIATTGRERSPSLPDVPTVAESGLAGYETALWTAIVLPAGAPPAIVTRLNQEMVKALKLPDTRERFFAAGTEVAASSPDELMRLMKSEMARWGPIIRQAGIRE